MNINRKIILVIAFLSAQTSLASVNSTALASIDSSDSALEEPFRVLITLTGVEGNCGEELTIIVPYKSDTFELCEGDERPLEEQRADPISSDGHEIEFPKGQIAAGESFDVCVEVSGGLDCRKDLSIRPHNSRTKQTLLFD